MAHDNQSQLPRLPKNDVSWLLNKIALQELHRLPAHHRVNSQFWNNLQIERPNLSDFIQSASYQIAPDDPDLRADVAAFGISLMYMFTQTNDNNKKYTKLKLIDQENKKLSGERNDGVESEQPAA
jgi:hypothetical protein